MGDVHMRAGRPGRWCGCRGELCLVADPCPRVGPCEQLNTDGSYGLEASRKVTKDVVVKAKVGSGSNGMGCMAGTRWATEGVLISWTSRGFWLGLLGQGGCLMLFHGVEQCCTDEHRYLF